MVSTSRVWGAGKILVLLAALTATFLVAAFVAVRMAVLYLLAGGEAAE